MNQQGGLKEMNQQVTDALRLLGFTVKDKVTGFIGTVTSISLDLYGCIQAVVMNSSKDKDGHFEAHWFDVKRLGVESSLPVMAQPDFVNVPGPAHKSIPQNLR